VAQVHHAYIQSEPEPVPVVEPLYRPVPSTVVEAPDQITLRTGLELDVHQLVAPGRPEDCGLNDVNRIRTASVLSGVTLPSAWFIDEPAIIADDHLILEVVTANGQSAAVEFLVRRDHVEVWHRHHLVATLERDLLRGWLAAAEQPLTRTDVSFGLERTVSVHGRTAITDLYPKVIVCLPGLPARALTPHELDRLDRLL
jgi:hypothetical protein